MNKKILLAILPPFWPKMPPLGLAYLESFLLTKNIDVGVFDINNAFYNLASPELQKEWLKSCNCFLENNILSIIEENFPVKYNAVLERMLDYDIVGFSCFKSNLKATMKIAKLLKARKNNIKIIMGGPEITRLFFKNAGKVNIEMADFIVAGEGELSLFNYISAKTNDQKISCFSELENLDRLDFPRYKNLGLRLYPGNNAIPLLFSRGCVKKCNFCSERLLYKKFRARPVKDVLEEIDYHVSQNKIEYFIFHDSLINADLGKLEELCEAIIKNFGSIKWEAQLYIRDDMRVGLFEKMKKSGCYNLFIGLESGCDRTLNSMNKGFTSKDAVSLFEKLRLAGLSFGVSIIIGYPNETEDDFRKTLEFIIEHKDLIPKIEQVNPFTYYDGTGADKNFDYNVNSDSLRRLRVFVDEIKRHGIKHTKAFLGNLIEKNDRI
ncbi:MAG: B12-binding domain-containing radical SAM protein [Candidatus Omnitrophota bacterium]